MAVLRRLNARGRVIAQPGGCLPCKQPSQFDPWHPIWSLGMPGVILEHRARATPEHSQVLPSTPPTESEISCLNGEHPTLCIISMVPMHVACYFSTSLLTISWHFSIWRLKWILYFFAWNCYRCAFLFIKLDNSVMF